MDIRSNEPFWLIKNSMEESYPSLTEDIDVPIVIIGAGITGALIAYQLLKNKREVIMIDRRDVFNGSSAASTAMLQYEIDVPLHELIDQVGLTNAVSSYKSCEQAIFNLEEIVDEIKSKCDFQLKKSVYFTTEKKKIQFLKDEFDARAAHGFDVKWLEAEHLRAMGILKGKAAIQSKSGAVMDPYKLAHDLLQFCTKKGMKIYDRTEIQTIKQEKEHLMLTTVKGIHIKTQDVIHCTGYESVATLNEDIVKLKSTYAVASEALPKLPKAFKECIFWDTSEPYLYFRSTEEGRIIMGGGDSEFKNAKRRDALLPKKEKTLTKAFKQTFQDIDFILDYAWAGTFGETEDGLPYIGKPDPDRNEHYVLGFGGNGITFSVMAMDAIIPSLDNKPHTYLEYYKFGR